MLTHSQCKELKLRNGQRKLENNTYLIQLDNGDFGVRLHNTIVVTIHADNTFTLNNGGFYSVTSKDRINGYSPARLGQEKFVWYLFTGEGLGWSKEKVPYENGIRIDINGRPVNPVQAQPAPKGRINAKRTRKPENSLLTAGVYVG